MCQDLCWEPRCKDHTQSLSVGGHTWERGKRQVSKEDCDAVCLWGQSACKMCIFALSALHKFSRWITLTTLYTMYYYHFSFIKEESEA